MEKQEILKHFSKPEDKLLIAKVLDKLTFVQRKNQVQITDFLDSYQQNMVIKMLQSCGENQYILYGGYKEAERKILFLYPDKLQELFKQKESNNSLIAENDDLIVNENSSSIITKNSNSVVNENNNSIVTENIKVISILLPADLHGTYHHSEYLGGIMKLGLKREKIGDIIVNETGADIIVMQDVVDYVQAHLQNLTRFQKATITTKEITNLTVLPTKKEEIIILIPQMRLDVIVSEILHLSRSKANEIIEQERVLVNYELKTKNATMLKQGDVLTIRGKGKYDIGEIVTQTAKGKLRLQIKKYIS